MSAVRHLEAGAISRLGSLAVIIPTLLFTALHYIPAAHGAVFDWNAYHARQDACREADRLRRDCVRDTDSCDQDAIDAAQRACDPFTSPSSQEEDRR